MDKRFQLKKISKTEMFQQAMKRVREQAEFLHKLYYKNDEKKLPPEIVDN